MQLKNFTFPAAAFLALATLPITGQAAVFTVPNFDVPGVPVAGFPDFSNALGTTIKLVKSGSGSAATYTLTANYSNGSFNSDPWTAFAINGSFSLQATFDSNAQLLPGGTVTINGRISGNVPGTGTPSGLLLKADLIGYGADTVKDATPAALAFATGNAQGWAAQFQGTGAESVYLYNFNVAGLMSSFTNPKFKSIQFGNANALTTVPVPAALWLFGSALLGLAGVRRRTPGSV